MARLTKSDVERLASAYDADPVGALCRALSVVLHRGESSWDELIGLCGFGVERRTALLAGNPSALDALLRDLIELREVPPVVPTEREADAT